MVHNMNQIEINKMTFESWLQDYFIDLREVDGVPIIKDTCEDLFEWWLENRDVAEMIELAERWGAEFRAEILKDVNELGKILEAPLK